MSQKKPDSGNFDKIVPEDYYDYEERFIDKSGKSGSSSQKGKKTFQALKKQQKTAAQEERKKKAQHALQGVLASLRALKAQDPDENLSGYFAWLERSLGNFKAIHETEIEISLAKSGGPGGQNVNKRETKVSILHLPTRIKAHSSQTRSQRRNKQLAMKKLNRALTDHLSDWKLYLEPGQEISPELVQKLLSGEDEG
jgi:hypothetical protein